MLKKTTSYTILLILFSAIASIFISCNENKRANTKPLVFNVLFNTNSSEEARTVILDFDSLTNRGFAIQANKIVLKDFTNDKLFYPEFFDSNSDGKPDKIFFKVQTDNGEIFRTFEINQSDSINGGYKLETRAIEKIDNQVITYLINAPAYLQKANLNGKWSVTIANSIIKTYPNPADLEIFSKGKWSYTNGFFINALFELFNNKGDKEYFDYVKNWVSHFVSDKGVIDTLDYEKDKYELDDILPGRSLLNLYNVTKEDKYQKASEILIDQLDKQPRTKNGGFWHKKVYKNQMWLDGIYMADVFLLQYASLFNNYKYRDEAVNQISLIYNQTRDTETGLLYHGWDESINKIWANPKTGTSPEFWGRSIGWYMMALADALDFLPENYSKRDSILNILKTLSASVSKYQDTSTGLWYQVVDKANVKGNWPETSCTAMFAYAFAKGCKKGYLDKKYLDKAQKAFNGLIQRNLYFDNEGKIYLIGTVKVGTLNFKYSDGSFKYYTSVDRRTNDFKGLAALLYLCMELEFK